MTIVESGIMKTASRALISHPMHGLILITSGHVVSVISYSIASALS